MRGGGGGEIRVITRQLLYMQVLVPSLHQRTVVTWVEGRVALSRQGEWSEVHGGSLECCL